MLKIEGREEKSNSRKINNKYFNSCSTWRSGGEVGWGCGGGVTMGQGFKK
jgi:hypothetical protein